MKEEKLNCIVYIARHGETEFNAQKRIQGHIDSPLTEKGIQQAQELSSILKDIHFDAVFSSDLVRAQKTAEIVTLQRNLVLNTTAILRERNYGPFEGKPSAAFQEKSKQILAELQHLSDIEKRKVKFDPGVESDEEITNRFILFLREVAVAYAGKSVLVISHGGIMRAFINHLGYNFPSGAISNTGFIRLKTDGVDFDVVELNGIKN